MEEAVHRLEVENKRLETALRTENRKVESMQQDLTASQEVC